MAVDEFMDKVAKVMDKAICQYAPSSRARFPASIPSATPKRYLGIRGRYRLRSDDVFHQKVFDPDLILNPGKVCNDI